MSPRAESHQRQSRRANFHPRPNHRRKRGNGHLNGNGAGHNGAGHAGAQTNGTEITTSNTTLSRRAEYAMHICGAHQRTVESIIEVGVWLIEAKKNLPHGEYEAMIKEDLPFAPPTARKYKAIAEHAVLANRSHVNVLPASVGVLYELALIKDEALLPLIEHDLVHPKMTREEAHALRKPPPARALPQGCPVCKDTAKVKHGHKWSQRDDVEDQSNIVGLVDDLIQELENILAGKGTLGRKIERLIDARVHPDPRHELAEACEAVAAAFSERCARSSWARSRLEGYSTCWTPIAAAPSR